MNLSPFTPDNFKEIQDSQSSMLKLEKLGNVWVGEDVAIEKPVVVNPGQVVRGVNLVIKKENLPPVNISRGVFKLIGISVRSFFAQTGIDVNFHNSNVSDGMLKNINEKKDVCIPIDIINHGQRPVEVEGNMLRFFWVNDRKRLRGQDIVNKIKSGEFSVEGVEGADWFLGGWNENDKFSTNDKGAEEALCVVVRLKPERFYIPYAPEPVKKDSTLATRENLSKLLKPIPKGVKVDFEIGETPKIKFGPNIFGVINLGWSDKGQKHINSPFIDSGVDWTIRTETLHGLAQIEFFLYEKTS